MEERRGLQTNTWKTPVAMRQEDKEPVRDRHDFIWVEGKLREYEDLNTMEKTRVRRSLDVVTRKSSYYSPFALIAAIATAVLFHLFAFNLYKVLWLLLESCHFAGLLSPWQLLRTFSTTLQKYSGQST